MNSQLPVIMWYNRCFIFFSSHTETLSILTTSLIAINMNFSYKIFIEPTYKCQWYLCGFICYGFMHIVVSGRISTSETEYYLLCIHLTSLFSYPLKVTCWFCIFYCKCCCHKHIFHIMTSIPLDTIISRLVEYNVILFLLIENHFLQKCAKIPLLHSLCGTC